MAACCLAQAAPPWQRIGSSQYEAGIHTPAEEGYQTGISANDRPSRVTEYN